MPLKTKSVGGFRPTCSAYQAARVRAMRGQLQRMLPGWALIGEDVVITASELTMIHTGYANAGVFTPSEVYVFPRSRNSFDYLKVMENNAWDIDNLKLLYPALLFYETASCRHRPND